MSTSGESGASVATGGESSTASAGSSLKKKMSNPLVLVGGLGVVGLIGSFFYMKQKSNEKDNTATETDERIKLLERKLEEQTKKLADTQRNTSECMQEIERQQLAFSTALAAQMKEVSKVIASAGHGAASGSAEGATKGIASNDLARVLKEHTPKFEPFLSSNKLSLIEKVRLRLFGRGGRAGLGSGGKRHVHFEDEVDENDSEDEQPRRHSGGSRRHAAPSRSSRKNNSDSDSSDSSDSEEEAVPVSRGGRSRHGGSR